MPISIRRIRGIVLLTAVLSAAGVLQGCNTTSSQKAPGYRATEGYKHDPRSTFAPSDRTPSKPAPARAPAPTVVS